MSIPASEAKSRLIDGNKRFINATSNPGDVSLERPFREQQESKQRQRNKWLYTSYFQTPVQFR